MKKPKLIPDYPVTVITFNDFLRLERKGWIADAERGGEIKLTKLNRAGMTKVKFVKIKD